MAGHGVRLGDAAMFGRIVTGLLPWVPQGIVKRVAMRYVAGEDLDAACATVAALNRRGFQATVDILGEDAASEAVADETVTGYREVLARIAQGDLRSNISVKLTHLGFRLDPERAERRLADLIGDAGRLGNFVRIDMEDSSLTQATLDLHARMRARSERVGTVLQAYLHRTEEDARHLAAQGANLRLCKGIYRESPAIAYTRPDAIRASYLRTAEVLLDGAGTYTAFATHDRTLLSSLVDLVTSRRVPPDRFEFQALLGVPVDDVLVPLVASGFTVRWYVPYGREWYAYSTRRLKENPKMATYIIRQILQPRKNRRPA